MCLVVALQRLETQIVFVTYFLMFVDCHALERRRETRESERESSCVHCLNYQRLILARTGPDWARSLDFSGAATWVSSTQVLEPSSVAS